MSEFTSVEDMRRIAQAAISAHQRIAKYAEALSDILASVRDENLALDEIDAAVADAIAKWRE